MQQARDRLADAEAILGTAHLGARRVRQGPQRHLDAVQSDSRRPATPEEAAEIVKGTAEFIAAIERLLQS